MAWLAAIRARIRKWYEGTYWYAYARYQEADEKGWTVYEDDDEWQ
jgi:hypothetical protein